ncbi:LysR family transcriptional regulator [Pigmentiphaga kullae]|uniref:LysR family transcriptional activator of glutamate synthase operon n=1 Tax=Pigmentiphaga kullae TaxID=151784 RepID=A0A4Q7NM39_9BURK|nr:LysR family transcriptional regulator [Pigmentiphaga kullae]RZS86235.1 LysR family transcriptional activator of glutamate synthase operon [Pigmentiphaga kullae]
MELKQLRALQAIADTGSFGEAAAQLGLTQSALSHQVRHLEAELDETLLIRARPKVYPSPAGLAVLASAQKIRAEIMALEARFARSKTGPVTGTLRIAATTLSIVYVLGDLCEAFIEKYPGIELIFTATESAEAAVRRVQVGTADVAFGPLAEGSSQMVRVALGSTEHAFIVRSGHPLAKRGTVSLDQLREFPFVLFQPGSGTRAITDELFLPDGGYPSILTESNDAQFIKRIVSISSGVALMPVYALADEVASRRLSLLRCAGRPILVDIGIVHKKNVLMNSIELFKSLCLDQRGPSPIGITIENARSLPFARY